MLNNPNQNLNQNDAHEDAVNIDGLEDLFRWTSPVPTSQGNRLKRSRDQRIRKQVFEFIQKSSEDKAIRDALEEVNYLQRRVIALLQSCNDLASENSTLKQIMVAQFTALETIPNLQKQIEDLKVLEFAHEEAELEKKELLNALAKMKKDRDLLEEMLTASEEENNRLANQFLEIQTELSQIKSRKWWHIFMPRK